LAFQILTTLEIIVPLPLLLSMLTDGVNGMISVDKSHGDAGAQGTDKETETDKDKGTEKQASLETDSSLDNDRSHISEFLHFLHPSLLLVPLKVHLSAVVVEPSGAKRSIGHLT